jgi:formate hydrogenlyase subunit 3/multisubunit Na+/H+ antiporter MnhD subunit
VSLPGLDAVARAALYGAILAPLLLAAGIAAPVTRRPALCLAPWAAAPGLLAALALPAGTAASGEWLLLGTVLALDGIGRLFLGFTGILWLLSGLYGQAYLREDQRRAGFFGAYLLAMAGNLGLCLAQDLVSFYFFFALLTFASYGLVIHDRSPAALAAGRVYLVLAVAGELVLFAGLSLLADAAGTLSLREAPGALAGAPRGSLAATLLLLGFGIKAGAVPLHVWLPLAHPAAPTPASAVLSGAMIKAGLLGWIRFLPLGEAALPGLGLPVAAAGMGAAFFGVLAGLIQRNPKALLAYSSVSQMGFLTLAVGLGLAQPALWPAGLVATGAYALHHGLAKGALFLGVGVAAAGPRGRSARVALAGGLAVPALSLAGAPFTSGAAAKAALKGAVELAPGAWPGALSWLLPLAAAGTAALMVRFLFLVWPRGEGDDGLPVGLGAPWALLVLACAGAAWAGPVAGSGGGASGSWDWSAFWPVAAGGTAALVAWGTGRQLPARVPEGDLLVPALRASRWMGRALLRTLGPELAKVLRWRERLGAGWAARVARAVPQLSGAEAHLGRWASLGVAFLLAALVQFGLFLW